MSDTKYMARAFTLAMKAKNNVMTNPNVGCVIVYKDRIIGEGYHESYGGPHAEVNAFQSINQEDRKLIQDSTVYVTLEPCCIHSKTPPCTDLILKEKVKSVVISVLDPNPKISGRGIEILRKQGVNVRVGILPEMGIQTIGPFIKNLNKVPFIILKWAQSKNNVMGLLSKRLIVTGQFAKVFTHDLRSSVDGILIGKNTALIDDPLLTTRLVEGKNPMRIILDTKCELPKHLNIFNDGIKTLICNVEAHRYPFEAENIEYINLDSDFSLETLCKSLYNQSVFRLLIEGGKNTLNRFISKGLWDEAYILKSNKLVGTQDENSIQSPNLIGRIQEQLYLGSDTLYKCIPRKSN